MFSSRKNKGFTLIELSIVLVIIGLMVSGIVGGQSLVKQARLRQIVADLRGFHTAWNAFEMQYSAAPGDFKEAAQYWPTTFVYAGDGSGGYNDDREAFAAWKHLALADIFPNTLPGDDNPGGGAARWQVKNNILSSKLEGVGYVVGSPNCVLWNASWPPASIISIAVMRPDNSTGTCISAATTGAVTPGDALSIDAKIDDGVFDTGMLVGNSRPASCYSATTASNYNVSNTNTNCELGYKIR